MFDSNKLPQTIIFSFFGGGLFLEELKEDFPFPKKKNLLSGALIYN